jgi:hypothetical protein
LSEERRGGADGSGGGTDGCSPRGDSEATDVSHDMLGHMSFNIGQGKLFIRAQTAAVADLNKQILIFLNYRHTGKFLNISGPCFPLVKNNWHEISAYCIPSVKFMDSNPLPPEFQEKRAFE